MNLKVTTTGSLWSFVCSVVSLKYHMGYAEFDNIVSHLELQKSGRIPTKIGGFVI
jgi:hypothetical protein